MRPVVAVFLALGGLVLEVLAQVAERAGDLNVVDELGAQHILPVFQLLLHLFDVDFSQFVVQL